MLIKTSELTGTALDWAVANCDGITDHDMGSFIIPILDAVQAYQYSPSTDWAQGGPVIEREGIDVVNAKNIGYNEAWMACAPKRFGSRGDYSYGPTPLIAAMRCYVAAKLGDEVEVPDELVKE